MGVIFAGIAVAIVIAVGVGYFLPEEQKPAWQVYSSSSTRVGCTLAAVCHNAVFDRSSLAYRYTLPVFTAPILCSSSAGNSAVGTPSLIQTSMFSARRNNVVSDRLRKRAAFS